MNEPEPSDLATMQVATLRGLAEQALLAQQGEATLDVEALSARLREVVERGGPPALGEVLLGLLQSRALTHVRDRRGQSCRKLAVEALRSLDVPEAREVPEEDLAFANARPPRLPRWLVPIAATLTALGGTVALLLGLILPVVVNFLANRYEFPPVSNLMEGLLGGVTFWRAVKLVINAESQPEDLRALMLLAAASVVLFLLDLPYFLNGGPNALTAPLFVGVPSALTALLLGAMGVRPAWRS
ncbi:hypothetical protein HUA76_40840 [Myxococcus sp. CA056]|uniref:hypothetical protein n=1 Tax=unclassified Myxococcus TaxID=2648731 RepID=UPI00157A3AC1|nr:MULTISPECIES: hypothetical protein [unclassified Myxococcus]NTX17141.1 hypothetical protein [Myxococcus sp. CA056]NTX35928.1 hypothetical protein [Myxococcus sp. CA033]NTX51433.1 hypothetical protein [Myxococcus sp. CA039A]